MMPKEISGRGEWIRTTDLLVPNLNEAFSCIRYESCSYKPLTPKDLSNSC
jgi:hypothetical protein